MSPQHTLPEEQKAWKRWTAQAAPHNEAERGEAIPAVKWLSRKIMTLLIASSKFIIEERKEIIGERSVDDLL